MDGVRRPFRRLAAQVRADTERIPDPALRDYLGRGRNWCALLLALIMLAVTWPLLGQSLSVPAYLLPILAVATVAPLALIGVDGEPRWWAWATVVVTCLVTALLPAADGYDWPIAIPQFLVLFVMTIAVLLTAPPSRLPVAWLVTALTLLVVVPQALSGGWISGLTVVTIGIAFVRYWRRSRLQIAEQTEQTELAQAQSAVLAERSRIARDLHDVVAHQMSMVVVMAQTARYRLAAADPPEQVPEAVAEEFEAIAGTAREALEEVRGLLGVLRTAAEPELQPAPGLADLPQLAEVVHRSGGTVELTDELDHEVFGPVAAMAIYRIVQESLTNAARHAPGAAVRVGLSMSGPAAAALEIVNGPSQAPTVPATGDSGGFGVPGMTERAAAAGGDLHAAPTADGGFTVTARIPAGPARR